MSAIGRHAAVVGGSLSGLCAGLALAPVGWARHDNEPAVGEPPGDAGLGLDRAQLSQVTGVDATAVPVITGNRDSAAWGLVRQFLIDVVQRTAGIRFTESVTVTGVRKPDGPDRVLDSTAGPFTADVVVGAERRVLGDAAVPSARAASRELCRLHAVARPCQRGGGSGRGWPARQQSGDPRGPWRAARHLLRAGSGWPDRPGSPAGVLRVVRRQPHRHAP
jgi:hypothetical protein